MDIITIEAHELALAHIGALLPVEPSEADLEQFAQLVLAAEQDSGTPDLSHRMHLVDGIAGRSVVIQAGTVLVGLPHKRGGLAVCVGDITVWAAGTSQRLTGAHILTTQPGGLRVGLAHADTTWLTVHANDTGSDDVEVIEDALVEGAQRLMTRRLAQGAIA